MFLVVDNLRVHRARVVSAWVHENAERIELYLPAAILLRFVVELPSTVLCRRLRRYMLRCVVIESFVVVELAHGEA